VDIHIAMSARNIKSLSALVKTREKEEKTVCVESVKIVER
jgi:hypothetical protein